MAHKLREPPPAPPSREIDDSIRRVLRSFAIAGLFLMYFPVDMWLGTISQTEIPIGVVKSVSAASGGLHGLTVLETDTGFYVLRAHAIIHKGTPLILDTRVNGDQYVCNAGKSVCVRTSSRHLSVSGVQPPAMPSQGDSAVQGNPK
jgi:hypothetical protein